MPLIVPHGFLTAASGSGHVYWRWMFTAGTGDSVITGIDDVELMVGGINQIPTMTAATTSGVTMSAGVTAGGGGSAWNAGDRVSGDYTKGWYANVGVTYGTNTWLKVQFASGQSITSYSLTSFNSVHYQYCPGAWNLQWSDDNSAWTTVDTRSSITWTQNQKQTFSF